MDLSAKYMIAMCEDKNGFKVTSAKDEKPEPKEENTSLSTSLLRPKDLDLLLWKVILSCQNATNQINLFTLKLYSYVLLCRIIIEHIYGLQCDI